jgi:hypothetical protein
VPRTPLSRVRTRAHGQSFNFLFGFIPLPAPLMLMMVGLTALYVLVTEIAKKPSTLA